MYRSFPNVSPSANKYLDYKNFLKNQQIHEQNIKNARGLIKTTEPSKPLSPGRGRKQKQLREERAAQIEKENQIMRARMAKHVPMIDNRNDYVVHSLNNEKRQRQAADHKKTVEILGKLVGRARSSYSANEQQSDYARSREIQKRMSRFSGRK